MGTVYLATIEENQYQWTAIGGTRSEAIEAIKRAYCDVRESDRPSHPLTGLIMTFDCWIEWHGVCVHKMTIGICELL